MEKKIHKKKGTALTRKGGAFRRIKYSLLSVRCIAKGISRATTFNYLELLSENFFGKSRDF